MIALQNARRRNALRRAKATARLIDRVADRAVNGLHSQAQEPATDITALTAIDVDMTPRYLSVRRACCPLCDDSPLLVDTALETESGTIKVSACPQCEVIIKQPAFTYVQVLNPDYERLHTEYLQRLADLARMAEHGKLVLDQRKPLDKLGSVKHLNARANGYVVTPGSYRAWKQAGMPPHPVFSPDDYRQARYVDNVLMPLGVKSARDEGTKRHDPDCPCCACVEYRAWQAQAQATASITQVEPRRAKPAVKPVTPLRFPLAI